MGVVAANGNHPCIWCTIPNEKFKNPKTCLDFSMLDPERGARSLTESSDKIKNKIACKKDGTNGHLKCNLGYTHQPFDFGFQYLDVSVDLLHLFLRISDKLLGGFREFLRKLDDFTSDKTIIDENSLKKRPFYAGFVQILVNTGIPSIVTYKDGIQFKDLTGPQYIKLFTHIDWSPLPAPIKKYKELSKEEVQEKLTKFKKVN